MSALVRSRSLDPGRSGGLPGRCPEHAPTQQRHVPARGPLEGWFDTPLLLHGGLAIAPLSQGQLLGAELLSGEERWRFVPREEPALGKAQHHGVTTLTEDGLVVAGLKSHLVALDAATGALRWKAPLKGMFAQPLVVDGLCFVNTRAELLAIEVASGKRRWKQPLLSTGFAWAEGRLYVCLYQRGLACLEAVSGTLLWEFPDPEDLSLHFAVLDGVLYKGTQTGLCALDAATGEMRWDSKIPGVKQASTPRVGGERILMRDGVFGALRAYDRSAGRTAWVFEEPRAPGGVFPWSTARVYEDAALVFDAQSTLHALRLADGAPRWQQPCPPKAPGGAHLWENQAPPTVDAEGRVWLAGRAGWTALEWG